MRYHYVKPAAWSQNHGQTYHCNHPLYNTCTLYTRGEVGLAVVQQRWSSKTKVAKLTAIDPWLVDPIYEAKGFKQYFRHHAKRPDQNGLYPTVDVRKCMYALRLKPIAKTEFERFFSP